MSLLSKLARDPQRSMRQFLIGLALFVISLGFVALGYYYQPFWQLLGLALMAVSIAFAIIGYVGIFAHRIQQILPKNRSK
jgi:hypothetical protein